MLKYLLISAMVAAAPACAGTIDMSCRMTPSLQQAFIKMGYPDNAQQVIHLSVDKKSHKVTVWETSPEFPNADKAIYKAKFTSSIASWTIGDIEDGPQAHDSVDFGTNVLTTIDPEGRATQWDCSAE